jgi:hypothetical protein
MSKSEILLTSSDYFSFRASGLIAYSMPDDTSRSTGNQILSLKDIVVMNRRGIIIYS